jgi:hypothetical protein
MILFHINKEAGMLSIVAMHGQARNGKDFIGGMLLEILPEITNKGWVRRAFADPVKEIFCMGFGVNRDFIEKWKVIPEPPPGFKKPIRKALQFIGDGFREILENCWINMAIREESYESGFVITDGRYPNEGKTVAECGGTNVVLWRKGFENDDSNRSESEIMKIVKWCLATNQDGPINFNLTDEFLPIPKPEGIENYHYFFRNNGEEQSTRRQVSEKLIPFIMSRK